MKELSLVEFTFPAHQITWKHHKSNWTKAYYLNSVLFVLTLTVLIEICPSQVHFPQVYYLWLASNQPSWVVLVMTGACLDMGHCVHIYRCGGRRGRGRGVGRGLVGKYTTKHDKNKRHGSRHKNYWENPAYVRPLFGNKASFFKMLHSR